MELVVASRNKHKLNEIKTLLRGLSVEVFSLDYFKGVPEVIEDSDTLEGNAIKKAVQVSRFLKKFVVADDSGLEVDSLNGQPGVYSARFSGKLATYESNNKKLLNLLKDTPINKRKACFRSVIAIADKGKLIATAEGRSCGRIGFKSLGKNGFGYDPLFIPIGHKKTFAQMSPLQKNKISHRGRALAAAKKIILKYL